VSQFAQAQTPSICNPVQAYFQKHDGTGTLPFKADYTTKLNNAAIKLVQTIPDAQCANFKVYDYGFTPINQYTKGGYAEDFEVMKLEAKGANRDQYYLLFAKEVNANNHVTKIWVDVELPKTGKFSCLSDMQRSLVKIRLEKAVEDNYYENQSVCFAESRGIAFLQQQVKTIVDCCANKGRGDDCVFDMTDDEILKYLLEHNFMAIPCKIIPNPANTTINPLGTFDVKVTDNANLTVLNPNFPNETVLFKHGVEFVMNMKKEGGEEGEAFITKNENFADFSFESIETKFNASSNKNDIWWHIWHNPIQGQDDYFLINRKDVNLATATTARIGERSVDSCNPDWEKCPCYDFERKGAKSGIFYIFGTGEKQTWGYTNYNWDSKCTTFKPSLIENIDFIAKKLSNEHHITDMLNKCFDWSEYNKADNGVFDRAKAADNLVDYVIKNITPFEKLNKNLPITLIGYSHGGNVAIQAAPKLYKQLGKKINLITISTPASNFTIMGQFAPLFPNTPHPRFVENPGNPINIEAINSHYHLWCKNDRIVGFSWILEGSHKYYFSTTKNIEIIDDGCVTSYGIFNALGDTHGYIHNGLGTDGKEGCLIPQVTQMLSNGKLTRQN
jgi:hypothetical protein